MTKRFLYLFCFFTASIFVFSVSCKKDGIPSTIRGKWKLILQGNDNANHRIDTSSLTRTNDSVLKEVLVFNNDDSTGTLYLSGLGLDSNNMLKPMDSSYLFSWIYFNSGPEIWIHLKENPRRRFHIWSDSNNVHLHVNYQDINYFCDYYDDLQGQNIQQIFQKTP